MSGRVATAAVQLVAEPVSRSAGAAAGTAQFARLSSAFLGMCGT